eukprot:1422165-Alexandrium_andersonii.AAC.1
MPGTPLSQLPPVPETPPRQPARAPSLPESLGQPLPSRLLSDDPEPSRGRSRSPRGQLRVQGEGSGGAVEA